MSRERSWLVYPSNDGERITEHTLQFNWISILWGNLTMVFADRADVLVAADNLIYPVEGDNRTRTAPDVYVAIGRPRGDRDCYKVWEERGIFPQVVFEVRPPSCRTELMNGKRAFYEQYGAQEYYDYDPFGNRLIGYRRGADTRLTEIGEMYGFRSPSLKIHFELGSDQLRVFHPNGELFRSLADWHEVITCEASANANRIRDSAEDADARVAEYLRLRALCLANGIDPDKPAM